MSNVPPGWYPDAEDTRILRWWDGYGWTEHVAPRGRRPGSARQVLTALAIGILFMLIVGPGGLGGLVIAWGLGLTIVGIAAVYRGGFPISPLQSRASALVMIVLSLAVVGLGSSLSGLPTDRGSPTANTADAEPVPAVTSAPIVSVTKKRVTERTSIPFESLDVDDPKRDIGETTISTEGVPGERTTVWIVTIVDGHETTREKVSDEVTREPVNQVTSIGSREPPPPPVPTCDPNYSGACVPIATDVDCAGGSGNGPAYVRGPVRVVGSDIYDLDRDGDGIGCD